MWFTNIGYEWAYIIDHPYAPMAPRPLWEFTLSVCLSVCPSVCRRHGFRSITEVCFGISISILYAYCFGCGQKPIDFQRCRSLSTWTPGCHLGFFGFRTLNLIWLWISSLNFNGTSHAYMERSLLIFSHVTFPFGRLVAILDFSVSGL